MKNEITFTVSHAITQIKQAWLELDSKAVEMASYSLYSFYQTYKWNEFLYRHIREELLLKRITCRFDYVLMESGGKPFAILPMVVTRSSKKARIPSCWVAGILNMAAPYTEEGHEEEYDALARYIGENRYRWCYNFGSVPARSLFAGMMKKIGGGCPKTTITPKYRFTLLV